jgi:EpsI family protein
VEHVPIVRPLAEFPKSVGSWTMTDEGVVEQEVKDVLKADDLLTRMYRSPNFSVSSNLFIGYFKSQRTGVAPHSPKNCLPGSGWEPSESGFMQVPLADGTAIEVNRYVVARGDQKSIVAYWYQSRNRVVASEYSAKMYTVIDSMRHNRTDAAIVRVVVPVINKDEAQANRQVVDLIQTVFPHLTTYFPA